MKALTDDAGPSSAAGPAQPTTTQPKLGPRRPDAFVQVLLPCMRDASIIDDRRRDRSSIRYGTHFPCPPNPSSDWSNPFAPNTCPSPFSSISLLGLVCGSQQPNNNGSRDPCACVQTRTRTEYGRVASIHTDPRTIPTLPLHRAMPAAPVTRLVASVACVASLASAFMPTGKCMCVVGVVT